MRFVRIRCIMFPSEILEMMMSEIRYGKTTLPECCRRIGERQPDPFGSTFLQIYESVMARQGENFFQHGIPSFG